MHYLDLFFLADFTVIGTIFGNSAENRNIGITGDVEVRKRG